MRIAHFRPFLLIFLISSFLVSDVSALLISLKSNERCERIAHFAHQKWAICSGCSEEMSDVSELLISLTKNERMSESLIFLSESLIRSFFDKKRAICSEIKWSNSQPCIFVICKKVVWEIFFVA